tara:strand:- start:500 stop:1099 length:600 start_codon:yes stop_codon:yes gene_type:complete
MLYKGKRIVFLVFLIFVTFSSVFAKGAIGLSPNEWAESFERYLYNLGGVKGKFTQVDQLGKVSKGTFWSNGRGSIKFSYAPDSALLIVINNGLISVRERDDGPISKYSIKDSPISDLFSENFNLEKFIINQVIVEGKIGTIELRTKKNSRKNSVYLTGSYPKPKLKQWKLIDSQNNETLVFFSKIQMFNLLDETFFVID